MHKYQLPYCGKLLTDNDHDRFLITMFMPPERREALWALFAFNHEIAKTREVVSDTTLGLIRLQWWRDAFTAFYEEGECPAHEILQPLMAAIRTYNLPRDAFESLIMAREFDLEDMAPETMAGLEKYADCTTTPLNRLACRILGDEENEAIADISTAYALTGLLRSIPFHAAQNRSYMPSKIEDKDVVRLVADRAQEYLLLNKPKSRFLKLQSEMARLYLQHLQKQNYDPYCVKSRLKPPFFALRLLLRSF